MSIVFWFTDLLIPLMLILISFGFRKVKPGPINNWVGYRTKRSRSSPEAWVFAQLEMGKWLLRMGIIGTVIVILDKLLLPISPEYLSMINSGINVALIIAIIPIVEGKLKRYFNLP